MDARARSQAHRPPVPEGEDHARERPRASRPGPVRRTRTDGHRISLGANRQEPEPRILRDRSAPGFQLPTLDKTRKGDVGRAGRPQERLRVRRAHRCAPEGGGRRHEARSRVQLPMRNVRVAHLRRLHQERGATRSTWTAHDGRRRRGSARTSLSRSNRPAGPGRNGRAALASMAARRRRACEAHRGNLRSIRARGLGRVVYASPVGGTHHALGRRSGGARAGSTGCAVRGDGGRWAWTRRRWPRRDSLRGQHRDLPRVRSRQRGGEPLHDLHLEFCRQERARREHLPASGLADDMGLRRGKPVRNIERLDREERGRRRACHRHASICRCPRLGAPGGCPTTSRLARQGRFHRPAVLRQHRLRRSVRLLLCLDAPHARPRVPVDLRDPGCSQGGGVGRHPSPARGQGERGGVLLSTV